MKKFFGEFKTFITRGNVMDMAVGVIIGGAFSAIVTALTNHILMPVINWFLLIITGGNGLDSIYTYLRWVGQVDDAGQPVLTAAGVQAVDLTKSIYIDWGAFITAIINFILIALVLFMIIKTINNISANKEKADSEIKKIKAAKKEMKAAGLNYRDEEEVKNYLAKKDAEEKAEADKLAEKQAAAEEEAKKHTTEGLLEQIKDLLEKQAK